MRRSRRGCIGVLVKLGLAGVVSLAPPGRAAAADDCGFLPDLRCERQARYEGFVAPMSAPYFFEDPFITTSLSLVAIWHDFPEKSIFQGGDAIDYAAQIRVALSDRLGFVASKDGRLQIRSDLDLLGTQKGYLDWMAGFKYALIDRPDEQFILTPSIRYQTTNGSSAVLASNGEGLWIPALALGKGLGDSHLLADVGARLPLDGDAQSTVLFYNLHLDRPLTRSFVPFVELNGLHYLKEGDGSNLIELKNGLRVPISAAQGLLGLSGFEAFDVANLGSDNVAGNDVISWAIGFRIAVNGAMSLGVSYERPLTRRRDILKQRISLNVLLEY